MLQNEKHESLQCSAVKYPFINYHDPLCPLEDHREMNGIPDNKNIEEFLRKSLKGKYFL